LLSQIAPHLPTSFGRYYEPFLGGGALFFLLQPTRALLSDANADLINIWQHVATQPHAVYAAATEIAFDKETYYEVRRRTTRDPVQRAGEFLYLNRGAFNGLYRVNRSGEFNVPWGSPRTDVIVELETLNAASKALMSTGVTVAQLDFAEALGRARAGDLVYLDPPYVTGHNSNGFIDYNEKLFSWTDQVRLAQSAERARKRGVHVLISNALNASIRALYPNFAEQELSRHSSIAGKSDHRGKATEALYVGSKNG